MRVPFSAGCAPKAGKETSGLQASRRNTVPPNKFSQAERQAALELELVNSDQFKDLPPRQIVPRLADQDLYVASESTLYRLMREVGQLAHRGLQRVAQKRSKPRARLATGLDQIYCWDISYLPSEVRGIHFYLYLYLFVDLFSRKIVGWQVYDGESADLSRRLLQAICERQGMTPDQLTVHSDNGAPKKGEAMLATMQRLGVAASRSRPAVGNGNPYSEALFRTLKYRPQMPVKPFNGLLQALRWVTGLAHGYNDAHRHSAIALSRLLSVTCKSIKPFSMTASRCMPQPVMSTQIVGLTRPVIGAESRKFISIRKHKRSRINQDN